MINGGKFTGHSAGINIEGNAINVVKISSGTFESLGDDQTLGVEIKGYGIWLTKVTDHDAFNKILADGSVYYPALEEKFTDSTKQAHSQQAISVLKAGDVPPEVPSVQGTLTGQGIYCAQDNPSIIAAFLTEKSVASDTVEYRWLACEESNTSTWFEVSPWTKDNYYLSWTPDNSGNYIIVAYARLVGNEEKTLIQDSFGVNFKKNSDSPVTPETPSTPQIPETPASDKIISQGIYCSQTSPSIIAGLVVDNKDSISGDIEYQWLVLNESTGAWAVASDWTKNNEWMNYTPGVSGNSTDKIKLSAGATPEAGKTMWTVWNPEYGYYITLFRLYDKDDNMIDEVSYGFANAC